jgi:hypothetical protein
MPKVALGPEVDNSVSSRWTPLSRRCCADAAKRPRRFLPESDIDFLVEFDKDSSLFDLMDLQESLQELLGASVDVVSVGGLKDRDDHIRREAVPI